MARLYQRFEHAILGGAAVLLFLLFWEGLSNGFWANLLEPVLGDNARLLRIRPIFISAPSRIWTRLGQMVSSGEIWEHMAASGTAFGLGGLMALTVGIPLGLAVGWYRRLGYAVEPFLSAYNATPQVVFIPLLIIWVGTGLFTKVLIIAMVTFIPLTMSAIAAVKTTDARLLKVAKSFGSSDWQRFRDIILPTSVPFLLSGLRLGVGRRRGQLGRWTHHQCAACTRRICCTCSSLTPVAWLPQELRTWVSTAATSASLRVSK